jgi:hypothetical protein
MHERLCSILFSQRLYGFGVSGVENGVLKTKSIEGQLDNIPGSVVSSRGNRQGRVPLLLKKV